MSKKIRKWIKNKKSEIKENYIIENNMMMQKNMMQNNVDLEEKQTENELEQLSNQLQMMLGKISPLLSRLKNKQKALVFMNQVKDMIQSATKMTDMQMRKGMF